MEGQYPQAYFRGSVVEDAPPLDLAKVGVFGLQTFGGVYDEFKQAGVGALEIDFIALQQIKIECFLTPKSQLYLIIVYVKKLEEKFRKSG